MMRRPPLVVSSLLALLPGAALGSPLTEAGSQTLPARPRGVDITARDAVSLTAEVCTSKRLAQGAALRGAGHLRLETRRQLAGTVVAYVRDVDTLGTGRSVAPEPVTWTAGRSWLDLPVR